MMYSRFTAGQSIQTIITNDNYELQLCFFVIKTNIASFYYILYSYSAYFFKKLHNFLLGVITIQKYDYPDPVQLLNNYK